MTKGILVTSVLLVGLLAACASATPIRSFTVGDTIQTYDFTEGTRFEEGLYGNAFLEVTDDVYRIRLTRGDNELWWGQWGETLGNVVIDVDVAQVSERNENAFGVGCRMSGAVGQATILDITLDNTAAESDVEATEEATAEATAEAAEAVTEEAAEDSFEVGGSSVAPSTTEFADGSGYLFLIQGTGSYAIMHASGRDVQPLVNWTASSAIQQGQASNQLRVVCVGNYLAFYINGQFVADATDDRYGAGQVALMASAATRLGATIEFDNLVVSEVSEG